MNRDDTLALMRRLIERADTNTTDEADSMMTESVADFLCTQRFQREREQFFLHSPQVVGFAGEVKEPGSFITTESMGIPLLITRDSNGILRAFINACSHRGAKVAHGHGNKQRLSCKFHGWTYDLDGQLYGRPQEACFENADKKTCGLRALPVSDRSGLIVIGLQASMPQDIVDNHLIDIQDQFAGFDFHEMHSLETRRFEVKANWKLIAALSYESYHFATLHRDSVAQWLRHNFVYDTFNNKHSRWSFPMKGIEKLKEKDETKWPNAIPGAVSHALFPGTVVITNPEDAQIIRTEPGNSVGTSIVYYTGVCRHKEKMEASRAAYDFGGQAFENEDLPAAIECQQGLSASRDTIYIGRNEPVVQFWHTLWRNALRDV
jgi:phenylpropionate dioxygenase-like ring-hydroxylating dioxygenase large terminal subunit